MSYPDSDERAAELRTSDDSFGRRTYIHGLGALAAGAGLAGAGSETAAAATRRRGIKFDRVVNVVDDLGLDPNGNEPVQGTLNNTEQDGTLFVFPEGEYLITDRVLLLRNNTVGVLGRGNASFVVPRNYNDHALIADRGKRVLFENMDLDLRANGATPGYKFGAHDRAEVHDVELLGKGIHPRSKPRGRGGNPDVTAALTPLARRPNATVVVENFVAKNDGKMGAYNRGDGRAGAWIGRHNKGTVTFRNCHFSGFPNNGLYTSRTPGVVQVEGGVYRNNDISQVRLGSKGSYVKNALIEVDPAKSDSSRPGNMLNGRGVRIESGPVKTAGVTVRNCDIRIAKNANSGGGVIAPGSGGKFDVINSRIRIEPGGARGVFGKRPTNNGSYAPPWPRRARLKNVSITGSASGGQAIELRGRRDSVIDSCCVEQNGPRRTAVVLIDSSGTVVKNSTLNVGGQTFNFKGTNTNRWGNSTSGSCPLPSTSGRSHATGGGSGGSSGNGGSDGGSGNDGGSANSGSKKRLEISGNRYGKVSYRVKVSGRIHDTHRSEGEAHSSSVAAGKVEEWADAFRYTGHIERLVVKGRATLIYDASKNSIQLKNNRGSHNRPYHVSVGDKLWLTSSTREEDNPRSVNGGQKVNGKLGNWVDEYGCSGSLRSVKVKNLLSVTVS